MTKIMNAENRSLMDVVSAANYLNVNEHFVRRLIRERRVAFIKIGRHVRFDPADLDALIEQGRREAHT